MKSIKEMVREMVEEKVNEVLTEETIKELVCEEIKVEEEDIIDVATEIIKANIEYYTYEAIRDKTTEIIEYYE